MDNNNQSSQRDPRLWELAEKRVAFKRHLYSYLVINAFLWILWAIQGAKTDAGDNWPWPVWPTLGWGIGVIFHYLGAYKYPQENAIDREYEKLKRKNQS